MSKEETDRINKNRPQKIVKFEFFALLDISFIHKFKIYI